MRTSDNLDRFIPKGKKLTRGMGFWCAKSGVQLAGRGRARQVIGGKAKPMIYAFVTDRPVMVNALHTIAMPGSVLKEWEAPESVRISKENQMVGAAAANTVRASDGAPRRAKELILPRLSRFRDGGGSQLSMRQIRQKLDLPGPREGLTPNALRKTLDLLIKEVAWVEEAVGVDGEPLTPRTLLLEREVFF